jgi:hypothetical protein
MKNFSYKDFSSTRIMSGSLLYNDIQGFCVAIQNMTLSLILA